MLSFRIKNILCKSRGLVNLYEACFATSMRIGYIKSESHVYFPLILRKYCERKFYDIEVLKRVTTDSQGLDDGDLSIDSALKMELDKLSHVEKTELLRDVIIRNKNNPDSFEDTLDEAASNIDLHSMTQYLNQLRSSYSQDQSSSFYLVKKKNVKKLLSKLRKLYFVMNNDELLLVLKTYYTFGLESQSPYMVELLQILLHHINELSFKHLLVLDLIVRKIPSSDLVIKISHVVPSSLEKYFNIDELANTSLSDLIVAFGVCIQNSLKNTHLVLREISHRGLHSPRFAMTTVWNIFDLPTPPFLHLLVPPEEELTLETLTKECLTVVERNIDTYSADSVNTALTKAMNAFENGHEFAYHEGFLKEIARKAVRERWSLLRINNIIFSLYNLNYVDEDLLSFFMSEAIQHLKTLEGRSLHVVSAISVLSEVPTKWHESLACLVRHPSIGTKSSVGSIGLTSRKAVETLSIEYFDRYLLENVLNVTNIRRNLGKKYPMQRHDLRKLLLINHQVRKHQEFSDLVLPSCLTSEVIEFLSESSKTNNFSEFWDFIFDLFEESTLLSNVIVQDALIIDKLIIVNEEGSPVLLNTEVDHKSKLISYENLDISSQYRRIAFMGISKHRLFNPGLKCHGYAKLLIQSLENEGFIVIPCYDLYPPENEINRIREILIDMDIKL